MEMYYVNLYLKIDAVTGEKSIITGEIYKKEKTAEKEAFGYYKKLMTTFVWLTDEEYKALMQ
ncbi:hypothetical protein D3C87_324780 [compost metagenome]